MRSVTQKDVISAVLNAIFNPPGNFGDFQTLGDTINKVAEWCPKVYAVVSECHGNFDRLLTEKERSDAIEKYLATSTNVTNIQNALDAELQGDDKLNVSNELVALAAINPRASAVELCTLAAANEHSFLSTPDGNTALSEFLGAESVMGKYEPSHLSRLGVQKTLPNVPSNSIAQCLKDMEKMLAQLKASYEEIRYLETDSEETKGLIAEIANDINANEARVKKVSELYQEAQALRRQQLEAFSSLQSGQLVSKYSVQIAAKLKEAQDLFMEVVATQESYLESEPMVLRQVKAEGKQQRALAEKVGELEKRLTPAAAAYLNRRAIDPANVHVLEKARRIFGFGADLFLGLNKKQQVSWKGYLNELPTWKRASWNVLGVLSLVLAVPILIIQWWSYGFNKIFSALFKTSGEYQASKLVPRLIIFTLAIVMAAIFFAPGINLAILPAVIASLVVAPFIVSLVTYFVGNRVEDYFARPSVTASLPKVEIAGQLYELSGEKLQTLLKTVGEMRRALLNETRALSRQESRELRDYEDGIAKGDERVIKNFLNRMNALLKPKTPFHIADLLTNESQRKLAGKQPPASRVPSPVSVQSPASAPSSRPVARTASPTSTPAPVQTSAPVQVSAPVIHSRYGSTNLDPRLAAIHSSAAAGDAGYEVFNPHSFAAHTQHVSSASRPTIVEELDGEDGLPPAPSDGSVLTSRSK